MQIDLANRSQLVVEKTHVAHYERKGAPRDSSETVDVGEGLQGGGTILTEKYLQVGNRFIIKNTLIT